MITKTDRAAKIIQDQLNMKLSIAGIFWLIIAILADLLLKIRTGTATDDTAKWILILVVLEFLVIIMWFGAGMAIDKVATKEDEKNKRRRNEMTGLTMLQKNIKEGIEYRIDDLQTWMHVANAFVESLNMANKFVKYEGKVPDAPPKKTTEPEVNTN